LKIAKAKKEYRLLEE
jgi:hypothetical protein